MPKTLHSSANLIENLRLTVDDGRSHSVTLDQPVEDEGTNQGTSALELCVMSLAGCIVTIFAIIARNSKVPLKNLGVDVSAVKSEEEGTITETTTQIRVKAEAPENKIRRIADMTMRTCPVGKLFDKASVKSNYTVIIEKE